MTVTERALQLARREGFIRLWTFLDLYMIDTTTVPQIRRTVLGAMSVEEAAANEYPLPMITVPRIEKTGRYEFAMQRETPSSSPTIAWRLQTNLGGRPNGSGDGLDAWGFDTFQRFAYSATPSMLRTWADLLENPMMEVEDKAVATTASDRPRPLHALNCPASFSAAYPCSCGLSTESSSKDLTKTREVL